MQENEKIIIYNIGKREYPLLCVRITHKKLPLVKKCGAGADGIEDEEEK